MDDKVSKYLNHGSRNATSDLKMSANDTFGKVKNENENQITVRLYYSRMDVKVSTTMNLIDIPTFVGSIGGNLGLFLGFSFLGRFHVMCDFFKKRVTSHSKVSQKFLGN